MQYEPLKDFLGKIFGQSPWMRKLFYNCLHLLLLRSWHIRREIRKWAQSKVSSPVNILDAGCGFGQYSYRLSKFSKQWSLTGIDVNEKEISGCNNFFQSIGRKNFSFRTGDLTKFRNENAYDMILCVDVMEHIEDDQMVFKNFFHSLKNGGILLLSTPSDKGGSEVKSGGGKSFIEEHVRNGYNKEALEKLLRQIGFSKTGILYSYGTAGHISWIFSMKFPILMLGASKLFLLILPFYYLITFPFCLILNFLDTHTKHKSGTGLIVKAVK